MDNISKKGYAPFMERVLQEMVQMPIEGICVVVKSYDGVIFTQYYNSTTVDKIVYAGIIQQDITMDVLKAHKLTGRETLEDCEDENG